MDQATKTPPREPLLHVLIEANKRAGSLLAGSREIGGKLFGARPEETTAAMPEMSCAGLAARLIGTLIELEEELTRQNNGLGDVNVQAEQRAAQSRAVASY